MPMIGLCFGHQIIATTFGGVVGKTGVWGLGATTTEFYAPQPWMDPPHGALRIYCAHEEQVTTVPEGMTVIARDPHCRVSACLKDNHIFTCQHHPEMPDDFIASLMDYFDGQVPSEVLDASKASLAIPAQGSTFARWMVNFLEIPR